ncbi:MAG: SBBP repeat-containing protein, partial [Planctomycetota bacterium]
AAWNTYLGGSSTDDGRGIAVDNSGNVLVTGYTQSSDLAGANNSFYGGSYDGFVANVTSGGSLLWSTYIGGSSSDYGYAIAVDSLGNMLIAGHTLSSNLAGANNGFHGGSRDAFVAKITSSGSLLWSTYLGGSGDDYAFAIAVDSSDNVFITGHTYSSNFVGAINSFHGGSHDAYIAKVTSNGTLVWARFLGGSSLDYGYGVATDSSGNALITGHTQSSNFAGAINSFHGGYDAFVAKVTWSGSLSWATYIGGSNSDYGHAIALESSGNPFVTGWTSSSNFVGANNSFHGGSRDCFVSTLTSDGTLVWATYLGGSDIDAGHGIVLDSSDNALLTGYTFSHDFNGVNNSFHGATADGFMAKVASSGSLLWSTYIGGSGNDQARAIAVNSSDEPLITGETTSVDIANSNNSYYGGSHDAFAAKIVESPPPTGVTVRGTVYDAIAFEPLDGATVIADSKQAVTDMNGRYVISGLTSSQVEIIVTEDSYYVETQTLPYTILSCANALESAYYRGSKICDGSGGLIELYLVPDYAILVDTGFRPIRNGFHFRNKSVPQGLVVGYCAGMTFAALNYWHYNILPNPRSPSADDYGWPTPDDEQVRDIKRLNEEIGVSPGIQNIWEIILGWSVEQNYQTLVTHLTKGKVHPVVLGPFAAHVVLAYKIVETSIKRTIWVYDNNKAEQESQIVLRKVGWEWQMDPYVGYTRFAPLPYNWEPYSHLAAAWALGSPAKLEITDPEGHLLDSHHSDIDGGYYRILDFDGDDHEEQLAIVLSPKEGEYLVRVVADPCAEPNETYTLEQYKFGKKTVLAEDVQIQNIPTEPYVSVALVPATIDIEADSLGCDEQYITAFIELPDNYIPAEIDVNTVYLYTYAGSFSASAESLPREIGDHDSDGIQDLMVEFDRENLIAALEEPNEGQYIELGLAGHLWLWDGTRLEGSDAVTLTLVDDTPPEFNLAVIPDTLWPPNHKMVQITPSWTAADLCDIDLNVSLVGIVMNEGDETSTYDPSFDDTVGDGHTTDDIQIVDGDIYLRAERSGKGVGRVYTITYQATDDSGNVAVASATVTVPHDQP